MAENEIVRELREWGENDGDALCHPATIDSLLHSVRTAADRIDALEAVLGDMLPLCRKSDESILDDWRLPRAERLRKEAEQIEHADNLIDRARALLNSDEPQ